MTFILIQSKINYVCLFKDVHSLFVYWRIKMFEKNKEKMKEKMIYLMNHEEKRNEMGNDAIRAIRKFDNKEICQKFFDFITKKC